MTPPAPIIETPEHHVSTNCDVEDASRLAWPLRLPLWLGPQLLRSSFFASELEIKGRQLP
jgi:hypothetical protein